MKRIVSAFTDLLHALSLEAERWRSRKVLANSGTGFPLRNHFALQNEGLINENPYALVKGYGLRSPNPLKNGPSLAFVKLILLHGLKIADCPRTQATSRVLPTSAAVSSPHMAAPTHVLAAAGIAPGGKR